MRGLKFGLFVVLLALLDGCGSKYDLSREVRILRLKTMPADSEAISSVDLATQGSGLKACWEFETNLGWPTYQREVAQRIKPDFQITMDAQQLRGVKNLPGDVIKVQIEPVSFGPPIRIRAELLAYPY